MDLGVITDEDKIAIINCLKDLSTCARCILRFLGTDSSLTDFLEAEEKLVTIEYKNDSQEPPEKKPKLHPCISCLGMLEDVTIRQFASQISLKDFNQYKYKEFFIYLSVPKTIALRQRSLFIYLKEKFPNVPLSLPGSSTLLNVKRIFRTISNEIIAQQICMTSNLKARFIVEFQILYENDEQELKIMKAKKNKALSNTVIEEFINKCNDNEFKTYFPVPPDVPTLMLDATVTYRADPIYLGGRYLKFSREIGQSPWVINRKPMTETSVQDIIFNSINKVLRWQNKMTFSASGREDSDVRMLGDGRPFYVLVENPSTDLITFEEFREIEEDILKSNMVAVIKLKLLEASDTKRVKDAEQYKKKHYSAICHTDAPDLDNVLRIINMSGKDVIEIHQTTPLRVLHRRTLGIRKKLIYSMTAIKVEGQENAFQLDLVTQAGTYVKEFVNSDFCRTTPSITEMIKYPVDIVLLDVVKVRFKFP